MSEAAVSKTLTVRIAPELYEAALHIAQQRRVSLNALLQQSLAAAVRSAEEEARYEEYSLLGSDLDESDLDYAIHAQAEVMLSDQPV